VIPSKSGKNRMFLHLDKNYYILYQKLSVENSLDGLPHKLSYSVRTYVDILTGEVIAADVTTTLTNIQTSEIRYPEIGELRRFIAKLPGGGELSGYGGVTLIAKRPGLVGPLRVDPAAGAQLHADITGSRPIDFRFSVSRGTATLLSSRIVTMFKPMPNYLAWASKTARSMATARMNSGQCPMRRQYQ